MEYTVTGLVATSPKLVESPDGTAVLSFRFASTKYEGKKDFTTNWFTIIASGTLARNCWEISKGDRLIVHGDLKIRDWDNGEQTGTIVNIHASAIGKDLNFFRPPVAPKAPEHKPKHYCNCERCYK
jgi:single-strand DNA-binding protein